MQSEQPVNTPQEGPFLTAARQVELIRLIVSHVFEVSEAEILAPTRASHAATLARQVSMYLCHVCLEFTYSEIGDHFGRDRTTASHSCRVVEERRDDREFNDLVWRMETAVRSLGLHRPAYLISPARGEVCS